MTVVPKTGATIERGASESATGGKVTVSTVRIHGTGGSNSNVAATASALWQPCLPKIGRGRPDYYHD